MPNNSSPRAGRPKKSRNGGTSRKGNYRSQYLEKKFQEALQAVKVNRRSLRGAAKHYGAPYYATLSDQLSERRGETIRGGTQGMSQNRKNNRDRICDKIM